MNTVNRAPVGSRHPIRAVMCGLTVVTGAAAMIAAIDPSLVASMPPHPTLRPTLLAILSLLFNNTFVLAVPFALTWLQFPTRAVTRLLGDTAIMVLLARSAITVGLALGRWQTRLLPYIPQLPLEYLAAAIATGSWLAARQNPHFLQPPRASAPAAGLTIALLIVAASVEVLLTPHAR